jgi:hypothetical protein
MRCHCCTNGLCRIVSMSSGGSREDRNNVPSPNTSNKSLTFSATCAASPWTASPSPSLLRSPTLTKRSLDTDRSTYITLHSASSMAALTSDQSCDQYASATGCEESKGQTGWGYDSWDCKRIRRQHGPSRKNRTAGRLRSRLVQKWRGDDRSVFDETATRDRALESHKRGSAVRTMALVSAPEARRAAESSVALRV